MDAERIRFASNRELARIARNPEAATQEEVCLTSKFMNLPVEAKFVAQQGVCDDEIYRAVQNAMGVYSRFIDLRSGVLIALERVGITGRISVLFDGIYVGHPEDIYHHRTTSGNSSPVYSVRGFGVKLADVVFNEA